MLRNAGKCLCVIAAIIAWGTAGSSDLNTISLGQALVQIAIALAIWGIGCGIMKITEV